MSESRLVCVMVLCFCIGCGAAPRKMETLSVREGEERKSMPKGACGTSVFELAKEIRQAILAADFEDKFMVRNDLAADLRETEITADDDKISFRRLVFERSRNVAYMHFLGDREILEFEFIFKEGRPLTIRTVLLSHMIFEQPSKRRKETDE